jgi:hypothetical protein
MPSYDATILAESGLVAYWPLNEANGAGSVADATGNGHTGTPHGGVTLGATSLLPADSETAATFDGSTGYISVPYAAALNTAHYSAEAWVKVTGGNGGYRAPVSNRSLAGGSAGWIMYDKDSNQWAGWSGVGGGTWDHADSGATTALSTVYHVVVTYDGTATRLYVNGALIATGSSGLTFQPNAAYELRIGAGQNETTPGFWLPGSVQKVAVYNVVLSGTQVSNHYSAGTTTALTGAATLSEGLGLAAAGQLAGAASPAVGVGLSAAGVLLGAAQLSLGLGMVAQPPVSEIVFAAAQSDSALWLAALSDSALWAVAVSDTEGA